jgi:uncharacterized protein YbjT (DUF2867 family)
MQSGLDYTILAANYFMEVWLSPALGFDYVNAKARIYGEGTNALSWVSFRDVGDIAIQSLDTDASRKQTLTVGGPEALSPRGVVEIFQDVSGRRFEIETVPESALLEQREKATDPLSYSFASLMLTYAAGCVSDVRETLSMLPVRLTSVREYATGVTAEGAARATK